MRTRRRERQRRKELEGIAVFGDVNELSISGHVEHQPTLRTDEDGVSVCEFALTHTTTDRYGDHWEHQRYKITAYHALAEDYADAWQPAEAIVIDGRLEHQTSDTLAGPIISISIVAHAIDPALGLHPHTPDRQGDG